MPSTQTVSSTRKYGEAGCDLITRRVLGANDVNERSYLGDDRGDGLPTTDGVSCRVGCLSQWCPFSTRRRRRRSQLAATNSPHPRQRETKSRGLLERD